MEWFSALLTLLEGNPAVPGELSLQRSSSAGLWYFRLYLPEGTNYRQVSDIRRTLAGNKIVDHSDVVGASPVGAAPTTSSLST